tara:strand:- start:174 stop:548 length:375 start_codon:yes stop_codon:yes gene_type:complete
MPKENKFESDKQRKWYHATNQDFWDEKKSDVAFTQMEKALSTFEEFAQQSGNSQLVDLAKNTIVEYSRILENFSKSEWWESLKAAGAVTSGTAGLHNKTVGIPKKKKKEEEYEIIPDEKDFWRD